MQKVSRTVIFILFLFSIFYVIYHFRLFAYFKPQASIGGPHFKAEELLRADETGHLFHFIAQKVSPAVVFIKTQNIRTGTTLSGQTVKFRQESQGSGFVVSRKGYIVTNAHVVGAAENITVVLSDNREFSAKLMGMDTLTDIALLSIKASHLTSAPLGNSDSLQPGEWVLSLGNPMGLTSSLTFGIVSAVGRELPFASETVEDYIQTDAAINPGNSGGPLINLDGEVVGMNTLIVSPTGENSGIGFSIPVNTVSFVVEELIRHGYVERGYLGVEVQNVTPALAEALKSGSTGGALVSLILPDSPAEEAGIQPGDLILAFNQKPIHSIHDLVSQVASTPPGKKVRIKLIRQGKELTLTTTIRQKGQARAAGLKASLFMKKGIKVHLSEKLGIELEQRPIPHTDGEKRFQLIITKSEWDATQDLNPKEGDEIRKLGGLDIETIRDFKKAEKKIDSNEPVVLLLLRQNELFYTSIKSK